MSAEQNKNTVRRFFKEVITGEDMQTFALVTSPDYHLYFPGQPPMIQSDIPKFVASLHAAFPDFEVRVDETVAEGDAVAALLTMSGTHRGEFQGMPATGRHMEVHGQVFFRFRGSNIVEDRPQFDRLELLMQLGVTPEAMAMMGEMPAVSRM